jgi:uncharacterized protein YndB with AHSA1/START domain
MCAPDVTVHPMTGLFSEVIEPRRLVFTSYAFDAAGKPLFEILNTVTFEEKEGRTTQMLDASVVKVTSGDADDYLQGMAAGWTQSLERLQALVEKA